MMVVVAAGPACDKSSTTKKATAPSTPKAVDKGASKGKAPAPDASTTAPRPKTDRSMPTTGSPHFAAAMRIRQAIREVEIAADVTCWTSFRQLDSFLSALTYSEHATLTKIAAIKRLVLAVWAKAAEGTDAQVTAKAIREAGSKVLPGDVPQDPNVANALVDYRKTSERWRLLLALAQDEILRPTGLKPLADGAEEELAKMADHASIALLVAAGDEARKAGARHIEPDHVKAVLAGLAKRFDLAVEARKASASPPPRADRIKELSYLTRALIDDKMKALKAFNRLPQQVVAAFNKISKLPFDPEALAVLTSGTRQWAYGFTRGLDPMRTDTFYPMNKATAAPDKGQALKGRDYVTAVYTANAITESLPHKLHANADLTIHYAPSPGTPALKGARETSVRLRDYQMDAVRDTAIHWLLLAQLWDKEPFAMDPFAAEYLSEIISVRLTLMIRRAQTVARRAKKPRIDKDSALRAPIRGMVPMPPPRESDWSAADKARRETVLASVKGPLFEDASAKAGLPASIDYKQKRRDTVIDGSTIQAVAGGGIAVGDINGDGYPDLFVGGEGMGKLFVNKGKAAPGTFVDATAAWKVPAGMYDVRQALLFDHDGDGDHDLLAVRSEKPSVLLRNDGKHFVDITKASGIATHPGAHTAAAFDADGDGDLDVLIGYYGSNTCNKKGCKKGENVPTLDGRNGSPNALYAWDAAAKTYVESAKKAGLGDVGWALAASAFDADGDGDLDLYIANDFGPNAFLKNQGDGTFVEVGHRTKTNDRGSGMNASFTDVDGDGRLDIQVTNIDMFSKRIKVVFPTDDKNIGIDELTLKSFRYIDGNKLFINPGSLDGVWPHEERTRFEPGDRGWGWATVFFDMDHDGDEDVYLANGWIPGSLSDKQKNQLFVTDKGRFFQLPDGPAAFAANTRAVATVDVDRDGDLDLVTTNFIEPPRLLKNVAAKKGTHLTVRLRGKAPNTDAIGAEVRLNAAGRKLVRVMTAGIGYIGQADPVLHFGLGDTNAGTKLKVSVRWPDGTTTSHELAAGKAHEVAQP